MPDFLEPFHIPAVTSLLAAFIVYIIIGKLAANLARGTGIRETRSVEA